jgi:L-lactate dehydrogenase complex protein LldF
MVAPPSGADFGRRVATALSDPQLRLALDRASRRFTESRLAGLASLPEPERVRDRARAIRSRTLAELDRYLEQFEARVTAAGGVVHWARDAGEACRVVLELARRHGVRRVVKSKSMISEEVGLNDALEAAGIEVVESDLGEYIIQLARETPSHIIAPAIHKTREQVGRLFQEKLGLPFTDDPAQMTAAARVRLREIFLTADLGVSGVNFGVAETGSLTIVSNEGNVSLTVSAPRLHVAMMGIERLVPTLDDLAVMLQVLARSATGQKLSVYTDLITGPRRGREGELDGPQELHVVLLDNGRSRVLGSEAAEILYCIRCGACLNVCPVYREIGGHAYGSVYTGPVGAVLTPAIEGLGPWNDLPQASSLCGACREVCPVRIDIPRMLLALRAQDAGEGRLPFPIRLGLGLYRFAATRPGVFRLALRLARALTRAFARSGWLRSLPPPLSGWTARRDFPAFARRSFSEELARMRKGPSA